MTRTSLAVILVVAMIAGVQRPASLRAQNAPELAGRWTLNRELSQFPEIGFGMDWLPASGSGRGSTTSGGRGRRGSGGGTEGGFPTRLESEDDSKRAQQLTAEVRDPAAHLTVVESAGAVTFTDDRGRSRTFHADGKEEVVQLDGVPVGAIAKRDAGRLVILYKVEQGRELRYTYSRTASPAQLVVDIQFVERGGGRVIRHIYEPSSAAETAAAMTAAPRATATPDPGVAGTRAADPGRPASADRLPHETFNQQPDAELKGLTKLGVVVEELSPQAAACGLNRSTLEAAVSKRLTDAGFTVRRNSDEDTYIYVNVMTINLANGSCVSRYDAFLYTYTTTRLSHQEVPVLVQVSLLHKGGLAGGASAAHAEAVQNGVQQYVDQFATRIREANK